MAMLRLTWEFHPQEEALESAIASEWIALLICRDIGLGDKMTIKTCIHSSSRSCRFLMTGCFWRLTLQMDYPKLRRLKASAMQSSPMLPIWITHATSGKKYKVVMLCCHKTWHSILSCYRLLLEAGSSFGEQWDVAPRINDGQSLHQCSCSVFPW